MCVCVCFGWHRRPSSSIISPNSNGVSPTIFTPVSRDTFDDCVPVVRPSALSPWRHTARTLSEHALAPKPGCRRRNLPSRDQFQAPPRSEEGFLRVMFGTGASGCLVTWDHGGGLDHSGVPFNIYKKIPSTKIHQHKKNTFNIGRSCCLPPPCSRVV